MFKDLFGNVYKVEEKTFEQEYQEYINSVSWKHKREQKLKSVGYKCEECGITKWSAHLEVHHLNYDHFKHEWMEDLKVLCPDCHSGADKKRQVQALYDRQDSSIIRGFENWMDRGQNDGWRRLSDKKLDRCWRDFMRNMRHRTGRDFEIPYWRSPRWK